jgi:hypothetical protein
MHYGGASSSIGAVPVEVSVVPVVVSVLARVLDCEAEQEEGGVVKVRPRTAVPAPQEVAAHEATHTPQLASPLRGRVWQTGRTFVCLCRLA